MRAGAGVTAVTLLTEDEAAAQLKVCARTLRKERQAGRLPYVLIGRRVLYSPSDIATLIERARVLEAPPALGRRGGKVSVNRKTGNIVPFSLRAGRGR
jgi:excisionase family DNA binding protein